MAKIPGKHPDQTSKTGSGLPAPPTPPIVEKPSTTTKIPRPGS